MVENLFFTYFCLFSGRFACLERHFLDFFVFYAQIFLRCSFIYNNLAIKTWVTLMYAKAKSNLFNFKQFLFGIDNKVCILANSGQSFYRSLTQSSFSLGF